MRLKVLKKSSDKLVIVLVVSATVATIFYGLSFKQRASQISTSSSRYVKPTVSKITALGRLQPRTEIISVSAPQTLSQDRVAQLLVKEGDRVQAGQIIAILSSRDRLEAAVQGAKQQVRVAKSQLAQVKAGAKIGEIKAQKATIVRLRAELYGEIATQQATIARWRSEVKNALAELNRYDALYKEGAIAASMLDTKRLTLETAQAQLGEATAAKNRSSQTLQAQINEAKATLNRIAQVRPVDIQVTQTQVDKAIASMEQAKTDLNDAYIKAPMTGQIVKIHTRPGEKLSAGGVVSMGQMDNMDVIAEVYQSDIAKVRVGQSATIKSWDQAFPGEVKGTIYQIGLQVSKQTVVSGQPGENIDRRVIEVKIALGPFESKRVATLSNLQVQVAIQ